MYSYSHPLQACTEKADLMGQGERQFFSPHKQHGAVIVVVVDDAYQHVYKP